MNASLRIGAMVATIHRRGYRAGLLVVALAVLAPSLARADDGVRVTWDAPDGCPGIDAVVAEVEAFAGASLDAPVWRPMRADLVASEDTGRWRVALSIYGPAGDGERWLEGASCAEVARAAALVVAMAMVPREEPDEPTPPAPVEDPPAIEVAPPQPPAPARARWLAYVGLSAETAALPGLAPGAVAGAAAPRGRWSAGFEVAYFAPREAGEEMIRGRFELATATARGCVVAAGGALRGCAGLELGWLRGRGLDISDPNTSNELWIAGVAGAVGAVDLGAAWRLAARLEVELVPRNHAFTATRNGIVETVYTSSQAGVRGMLGVEWKIF